MIMDIFWTFFEVIGLHDVTSLYVGTERRGVEMDTLREIIMLTIS
jgi:hypothetical protein